MKSIKKHLWKFYVAGIILASLPLVYYSVQNSIIYIKAIDAIALRKEITDLLLLTFICALTRSLPLYIRDNEALELSIITVFTTLLLKGVWPTIAVVTVATLVTVEYNKNAEVKYKHIFNTPVYKTLFNYANLIISIFVGSLVFKRMGWVSGDLTLPHVLPPAIGFLIACFFTSTCIMSALVYQLMDKKEALGQLIKGAILSLFPNLVATAPIGFFLAMVFNMPSGSYIAVLFLLPLLFARYAFILYLDSKKQFYRTVKTLTAAIEAKDKYTEGHSKRVEQYSELIARGMKMAPKAIEEIKIAALLHDIGKIGVEDSVLRKASRLSDDEWEQIKRHPEIGVFIVEDIDMPGDIKDIILYHHLYFNGTGYPLLKEEPKKKIPLGAYIIGVADAYDAMTSDRPYRKAMEVTLACDIIADNSGTQFHPDVAKVFLDILRSEEVGYDAG